MTQKPSFPGKTDVLRDVFGHNAFRPGQETIADAVLRGRDVLAIMPTGAGKSLCYQLPAVLLPGLTIVISPLIALMTDQVLNLKKRGIPAEAIHSGLSASQKAACLNSAANGSLKLLYLSPETFAQDNIKAHLQALTLSLICIDEAHCISSWGSHFRPSYRALGNVIAALPCRPPIIALTASATWQVRDDIISVLGLRRPLVQTFSFDRPNLYFEVQRTKDKAAALINALIKHRGECGIIYCLTRRTAENLAVHLSKAGFPALVYHAGLDKDTRQARQDAWTQGDTPLMIATNAFGMGIDKPDVRFVIHYNMPAAMEAYYQEAGRAGRDGRPADCLLLVNFNDLKIHDNFIRRELKKNDNPGHRRFRSRTVSSGLPDDEASLRVMIDYAGARRCLRHTMLSYFGENSPLFCGSCSFCQSLSPGEFNPGTTGKAASEDCDTELCRYLFIIRRRIAEKQHKPAYKIFPDTIIREIAYQKPRSFLSLLTISDISPVQVFRFGRQFIIEVRNWPC